MMKQRILSGFRWLTWMGVLAVISCGIITNIFFPHNLSRIMLVLGASVLVLGGCYFGARIVNQWSSRTVTIVLSGLGIILVLGQLGAIRAWGPSIYHDPLRVIAQAIQLAHGPAKWGMTTYFYRYPNNVVLTVILAIIIHLGGIIGIKSGIVIQTLTLVCLDAMIALMTHLKPHASNAFRIGSMLFWVVNPLSYTYLLRVCYSDGIALLALTSLIFMGNRLIQASKHRLFLAWGCVGVTLLGFLVKPNLIILGVAAVMTVILLGRRSGRKQGILVFTILAGLIVAPLVSSGIKEVSGFHPNSRYQLPVASWILMGQSRSELGTYNGGDVAFLEQTPTSKRMKATNQRLSRRLKQNGVGNSLALWLDKGLILLNGHDLTRAYVGCDYRAPKWYLRHERTIGEIAAGVLQVELVVLWASGWFAVVFRGLTKTNVMWALSLVGLFLFHAVLWETETRYGLLLIPLVMALINTDGDTLFARLPRLVSGGLVPALVAGIVLLIQPPINSIVALDSSTEIGQMGQLSLQYHAPLTRVPGGMVVTQKFILPADANGFTVDCGVSGRWTGTLIRLENQHQYPLRIDGDYAQYSGNLPAGKYNVVLRERSREGKIQLLRLPGTQISSAPVKMNGHVLQATSLIYHFTIKGE